MTAILLVLVCLLAAVVFIQLGALIEMYGQLQQVRTHLDLVDRPDPLDLGVSEGSAPSSVGLPRALDEAEKALVVFLSNKCQTCFDIAGTLSGTLPRSLWLIVVPVAGGDASDFVERFELRGERILVDDEERISASLGLDITPSALEVEQGRLVRAQTVPTIRQLYQMLPTTEKTKKVLIPAKQRG